jgi:hypothetical protein
MSKKTTRRLELMNQREVVKDDSEEPVHDDEVVFPALLR